MVVGAGKVAAMYLDYFSTNGNHSLVIIAETNTNAAEAAEMRYRPKLLLSDYREGLCREDIDLVVICTPHHLHHDMAIDVLEAGKHVFCEKPMGISVQEADEMIDAASHHNHELFVMLNMRSWHEHRKLKELIADNVIGRVFMIRASYLGYESE